VRSNALAAAFDDPRCTACRADELDSLSIEVSLLGEARPLRVASEEAAWRALRPGVDGVVLRWHDHQATLLPQMWEQLPDPPEFVAALKRKAGLESDFWADDVELATYPVRSFAEPVQR
jgi:AmmeMemoRadiSam system protein A